MTSATFRILGPLEVGDGELPLPHQAQVVLGVLLLRPNELVSLERLADEIWGEEPPSSWVNAVQVYVSRLRKALVEAGVAATVRRHGPGYVLQLDADEVDSVVFERLCRSATALAGRDPAGARAVLVDALSLWRGPVLAGLTFEGLAAVETERLEERHRLAIEERLELELELGHERDVIPELEQLVAEHPFRERLWCALVVALYRSGRQAEALEQCRRARSLLLEELGLEPGDELRELELRVLRQDPELAPTAHDAGVSRPSGTVQARRPVTVVAARFDSSGLEELDPEVLDAHLVSLQVAVRGVLEASSATVAEAAAGSVLGIFGLPEAREDDALRACRAALAVVGVASAVAGPPSATVDVAVESGDVVVDESSLPRGALLATVERLPGRAGKVTLGPRVHNLVGDAADVEDSEGVRQLVRVGREAEAIPRNLSRPLIGRNAELDVLSRLFARCLDDRMSGLVTVTGPAGIGKSRLITELASLHADGATILRARCVPDDSGSAFAPLIQLGRDVVAAQRPEGLLGLVAAEDDPDDIVGRFLALAGLDEQIVSSPEETSRAVRKVFEALARSRPLLALVDDLHWAEPAFLDLLDDLADVEAPLLVACTARPEILDRRPNWIAVEPRRSSIGLEPLPDDECGRLLDAIRPGVLAEEARSRIVAASAGNPLFLEQLAALESEWRVGGLEPPVPSSLRGLLLARLDRLDPAALAVLETASILSEPFRQGTLESLSSVAVGGGLGPLLGHLVESEFLRRVDSSDGLAFAHPLIRSTVYETLPKLRRAELHEHVAGLNAATMTGSMVDELVGHHLERAFRCRVELAPGDVGLCDLATRAREHLTTAGRRRFNQGDVTTAVSLLARAESATLGGDDVPPDLLLDLGDATREAGRLDDAEAVLRRAADGAFAAGDEPLGWRARASLVRVRLQLPGYSLDEVKADADATLAELSRLDDPAGLAVIWWAHGWMTWLTCQAAATENALTQSMAFARRIGSSRIESHSVNLYLGAALFGPMPVGQAVDRCLEFRRRHHDRQRIVASCARALAVLRAMQGDFDDARRLVAVDQSILSELGMRYQAATAAEAYGLVELLAGEPDRAERLVRSGFVQLERMGDTSALPTVAALLGDALVALERYDEAVSVTDDARRHADGHDLGAQVQWRSAHAKALAWLGRDKRALKVAQDAVRLAERTDFVTLHGDALTTLGEVHRLGARRAESAAAFTQAVRLYEEKGNTVAAARARVALRAARRGGRKDAAAANVG